MTAAPTTPAPGTSAPRLSRGTRTDHVHVLAGRPSLTPLLSNSVSGMQLVRVLAGRGNLDADERGGSLGTCPGTENGEDWRLSLARGCNLRLGKLRDRVDH